MSCCKITGCLNSTAISFHRSPAGRSRLSWTVFTIVDAVGGYLADIA